MKMDAHLDLDVVAVETDDEVSVLVELTAPPVATTGPRPPATLQVVLDRSGSMDGGRLEAALRALDGLITRLDPSDRFGVVAFDHEATAVVPCGPLTDKDAVRRRLAQVHTGGTTDLSAGLLRGLQEVQRAGSDRATLVLVSDGHANRGITDHDQLADVAAGARSRGTTVTTLGMGLGYDEALLAAVAGAGGGAEHFAEEPDAAEAALAAECEGLLTTSAQAVTVLLRLSPAVRGVVVHNELPVTPVEGGHLLEIGSLLADETRKLALTLDVPGTAALGLLEVASLEIRWVALPDLVEHVATLPLVVNVVPGDQAAGRVPDPVVRAEVAYLSVQRAKRDASRRLAEGDARGAVHALHRATGLLDAAPPVDAMATEWDAERRLLEGLRLEAEHGSASRASKTLTSDSSAKSRYRGRRP